MKILIAEDEPANAFVLEIFLRNWGYEVTSTDNGKEAWQILQQENSPWLVILDWMLPGMGGVEVCREVKKATDKSNVYILMLTAKAQGVDIRKGLEAGADDYMTKPFDVEELRQRLLAGRRILESKGFSVA